jgi:C1A family cysteine protease
MKRQKASLKLRWVSRAMRLKNAAVGVAPQGLSRRVRARLTPVFNSGNPSSAWCHA